MNNRDGKEYFSELENVKERKVKFDFIDRNCEEYLLMLKLVKQLREGIKDENDK